MIGLSSPFVLHCLLIFSSLGSELWQLKSSCFSRGNYKKHGPGRKLWALQTTYGRVFCAKLCLQNSKCWYFRDENQTCYGYDDKKGRSSVSQTPMTCSGGFKRYRKMKEREGSDDYIKLGSSGMHVKRHDESITWHAALQVCQTEGATLVKLDPPQKRRLFNKEVYSGKKKDYLWIGLLDMYDNDTWYWTDGTKPSNHRGWKPDEPNNEKYGFKENCGATYWYPILETKWIDAACNHTYSFVCEKNITMLQH